jgi:hypothetical protein
MKTRSFIILTALSVPSNVYATRFEFKSISGFPTQASIETHADVGENVPIIEAVSAIQFQALSTPGGGFLPDLPPIPCLLPLMVLTSSEP